MAKSITPSERAYMDYIRRRGVQTSNLYARKLAALRKKEVNRVLKMLDDFDDTAAVANLIRTQISENAYFYSWMKSLMVNGGLPMVTATARQLTGNRNALDAGLFEKSLADFAEREAGDRIVIVTGTLKDDLVGITRKLLLEDNNMSVEQLAQGIREGFSALNLWQARRIAQTEMMNSLAEAGHEAATALDIRYTKQWCCSGLTNTRETHLMMDGVMVDEDEPFYLADCSMDYPHDVRSNPPAGEIINCACTCIRRPK